MILLSALLQPNKVFWRKSVRKPHADVEGNFFL